MNTGSLTASERMIIMVGLLAAAIFGLAGGAFSGSAQSTLFVLSSLGWVSATALLALHHYRQNNTFAAAGMLLLTIAETLIWVSGRPGDPGYDTRFAGAVMFYVPGLLLISVPQGLPIVVRLTGIAAAIAWVIFAVRFLMGQTLPYTDITAIIGYVLISITMIGWIVALGRTKRDSG